MKTALGSSFSILIVSALCPLACGYTPQVDVVQDFCAQVGEEQFEYLPLADTMGTFEPGYRTPTDGLIVDDDDLLDDFPIYSAALTRARELLSANQDAALVYESMDPEKAEEDYTDEENAAVAFVEDMVSELSTDCLRLSEALIGPRPGDLLREDRFPPFVACKDRYNASGDGVVGTFELLRDGHAESDAQLAKCRSLGGSANTQALNFWGPLSTQPSKVDGLPSDVYDGFTFSGITIPLTIATYRRTEDHSQWEGVAFWARVAQADEAIDIQNTPGDQSPYSGRSIPDGARPQDGVGQLGVIIQTIDTTAVLDNRGNVDGMGSVTLCQDGVDPEQADDMGRYPFCLSEQSFDAFPGLLIEGSDPPRKYAFEDENGRPQTPEVPFCIDYSPIDTKPGEETPFRDQCWDGFRTMVEPEQRWRFFRLPFSEMRQAGWGRVAQEFRIDQIRSVNLLTSAFQPVNIMVDEISFYRRK